MKSGLIPMSCFLIIISSCTFPGGKQDTNRIRLSIQNTLRVDQENIPIILTLEQLKKVSPDFSLNAFSVVTGEAPREVMVPAQADDLDYDGIRDQLIFLLDLKSEETKEISILYDPNVKATFTLDVQKLTRVGIFPELNAIAAIESDLVAYTLLKNGSVNAYGKKRQDMFSVDVMYQSELDMGNQQLSPEFRQHFSSRKINLTQNPQALNINVKKVDQRWIINDFENQENYYVRKSDKELTFSKSLGLSLNELLELESTNLVALTIEKGLIGCGGIALWHKSSSQLIPLPHDGDYVRILANGAMRSIVQRILPNFQIGGEIFHLSIMTSIYGRNPWFEQTITLDKDLPSDYAFVVGIPRISEQSQIDREQGVLWSWGKDPKGEHPLGLALIYPKNLEDGLIDTDPSILSIIINPDVENKVTYRTAAIWDGGIDGVQSEAEFMQQLQLLTTTIFNPPNIKFIKSEEQ